MDMPISLAILPMSNVIIPLFRILIPEPSQWRTWTAACSPAPRTASSTLLVSGEHKLEKQIHLEQIVSRSSFILNFILFPFCFSQFSLAHHTQPPNWMVQGHAHAWSMACHARRLSSTLPPVSPVSTSPSPAVELWIPSGEVFSKQRALSLPPHRPYNCAIDLLPGPSLSSSRLYLVSILGVDRSSSSPVGAGLFFIKKKDVSNARWISLSFVWFTFVLGSLILWIMFWVVFFLSFQASIFNDFDPHS